jgi:CYTH domain-containing protein
LFEKRLKYARVEAERRFLLAALPAEIDPRTGYQTFDDLYFLGTTLRLRRVTSPDGATVELKLNQKLPHDPPLASHRVITSVYLTPADFALLSRLDGARLVKRRYAFLWKGAHFGVDVFQESLAGLVLAEAEAAGSAVTLDSLPKLPGHHLEVTDDPRFCGGNLAAVKPEKSLAFARELLER